MGAFADLFDTVEANDTAAGYVRSKIREIVHDPATAEFLSPHYLIGCKRLCVDTDYYTTYNRDNVTLVDVRSAPIEAITEQGIRAENAEYELDAIVFATGFDAMTGAMLEIDIQTRSGARLAEKWERGPQTYLGLMVAGFPNMFMITGPQSPSVKVQMILGIEQHADWIIDCLKHLKAQGLDRIEAEQVAEDGWVRHNDEVANATLYPLANSWYMGANIPGKSRGLMPYVGGFDRYKQACDDVASKGYEGFRLT